MNLTPLLEREKESVECSKLFKANSVFPLEVWHMLFPGSIGFIQTKNGAITTYSIALSPHFPGPASLKAEMLLDDAHMSILYGLSYTKGRRRLLFAATH